MEYGLGWKPREKDPNDWTPAMLKAMIAAGAAHPIVWETAVRLNQGSTNHCGGYSLATLCASSSSWATSDYTITNALGERVYYKAKEIDGNPKGEDGTDLRSIAKAGKALGLLDYYAFGTYEDGEEWTQNRGPCIYGLPWYEGMFNPDAEGLVKISGAMKGGHAICRTMDEQLPYDSGWVNTWGADWGDDGRCFMERQTLYQLVDMWGEVLLAVKAAVPPVAVAPSWLDALKNLRKRFFGG